MMMFLSEQFPLVPRSTFLYRAHAHTEVGTCPQRVESPKTKKVSVHVPRIHEKQEHSSSSYSTWVTTKEKLRRELGCAVNWGRGSRAVFSRSLDLSLACLVYVSSPTRNTTMLALLFLLVGWCCGEPYSERGVSSTTAKRNLCSFSLSIGVHRVGEKHAVAKKMDK